jgi:hypothetical protein
VREGAPGNLDVSVSPDNFEIPGSRLRRAPE